MHNYPDMKLTADSLIYRILKNLRICGNSFSNLKKYVKEYHFNYFYSSLNHFKLLSKGLLIGTAYIFAGTNLKILTKKQVVLITILCFR